MVHIRHGISHPTHSHLCKTHTLIHTHSYGYSPSRTYTHTLSHIRTHTHTHMLTLTHSLSHIYTFSHIGPGLTHTFTHRLLHTQTKTHTLTLTHTQKHTHIHSHVQTHRYLHTHSYTHTHSHIHHPTPATLPIPPPCSAPRSRVFLLLVPGNKNKRGAELRKGGSGVSGLTVTTRSHPSPTLPHCSIGSPANPGPDPCCGGPNGSKGLNYRGKI